LAAWSNGGIIYRNHDIRIDLVDAHAAGDQQMELLGCFGEFLKVQVKKGIGWTREACTNLNTICS